MVGGKDHIRFITEQVDRLSQILRPAMGVADDCSTEGEDVMEGVGGVFSSAEGLEAGEVDEHLRGSFRVRRHLEDHLDAIDGFGLIGRGDDGIRRNKGHCAC